MNEPLSRAALEANLEYSRNRLKRHEELGKLLKRQVEKDEGVLENNSTSVVTRFQAVFDEENFLDAIWFLQDEPEIQFEANQFLEWKKKLEEILNRMGVKFQ